MTNRNQRPLRDYLTAAAAALMVTFGGSLFVAEIGTAIASDESGPTPGVEAPAPATQDVPPPPPAEGGESPAKSAHNQPHSR